MSASDSCRREKVTASDVDADANEAAGRPRSRTVNLEEVVDELSNGRSEVELIRSQPMLDAARLLPAEEVVLVSDRLTVRRRVVRTFARYSQFKCA